MYYISKFAKNLFKIQIIVSFILSHALLSYPMDIQDRYESVFPTEFKRIEKPNKSFFLKKRSQGQVPANALLNNTAFENIKGLKEYITQIWYEGLWRNNVRKVFTSDSDGNIIDLIRYYYEDSTGTWYQYDRRTCTYHAPGKMDTTIHYRYTNGTWIKSGLYIQNYNEFDSLSSTSSFDWDSVSNDWDTTSSFKDSIYYGTNGKINAIKTFSSEWNIQVNLSFTYLPDGRINVEDLTYINLSNGMRDYSRTLHYYPDLHTELIVSQETYSDTGWQSTDSVIVTYNTAGFVSNKITYVFGTEYTPGAWVIDRTETTTFDTQNRPIISFERVSQEPLIKDSLGNSSRILFFYDSTKATKNYSKKANIPVNVSANIHEHALIITGLPQEEYQTKLSILNLNGSIVHSSIESVRGGKINFQLKQALSRGFYYVYFMDGTYRRAVKVSNLR
jgi:hypothetical protein